jgi:hypothetical protein
MNSGSSASTISAGHTSLMSAASAERQLYEKPPKTIVAVGNKQFCAPIAERLSRETAKTCEHGNRKLINHGKVYGNPVALPYAFLLQHVCELRYFLQHFLIGELHYVIVGLALENDGGLVAFPFLDLRVKAVV